MSELKKTEWRLTLQGVKEKHWPILEKKLYFRCLKCGKPRDFKVEGVTVIVPVKCAECGHNVVKFPAKISMGRGFWSDVLMLGVMFGFPPMEAYTQRELNLELALK